MFNSVWWLCMEPLKLWSPRTSRSSVSWRRRSWPLVSAPLASSGLAVELEQTNFRSSGLCLELWNEVVLLEVSLRHQAVTAEISWVSYIYINIFQQRATDIAIHRFCLSWNGPQMVHRQTDLSTCLGLGSETGPRGSSFALQRSCSSCLEPSIPSTPVQGWQIRSPDLLQKLLQNVANEGKTICDSSNWIVLLLQIVLGHLLQGCLLISLPNATLELLSARQGTTAAGFHLGDHPKLHATASW